MCPSEIYFNVQWYSASRVADIQRSHRNVDATVLSVEVCYSLTSFAHYTIAGHSE